MEKQPSTATDLVDAADPTPFRELDDLLVAHPWLKSLEHYYIEWELVWPM
jgi:hypothetical protein